MRFALIQAPTAIILFILSAFTFASSHPLDIVSVVGKGSVKAEPEIARLNLSFQETDLKVEVARQKVEAQIKSLIKSLKRFDMDENALDTSKLSINPQYDYNRNTRILRGYQLTRRVEMTLLDLDELSDLVTVISSIGPSALQSIQFDVVDRSQFERAAMDSAMAQSIQIAERIAATYGAQLGKLHQASYGTQNPSIGPVLQTRALAMESASNANSFEQKQLTFRAQIHASFHLQ